MKKRPIIVILIIIAFFNIVGFTVKYLVKNYLIQRISFTDNLGNLGSSLVTYSTAMMALLIVMVVVLFGIQNIKFKNFEKSGYLHATYLIYMVTFFELGLTMTFSLLCLSNIKSINVASLSLTFALITFLLICILGCQLIGLKKLK